MISIVLAVIPVLCASKQNRNVSFYTDCIDIPLNILCSLCLIFASLWIRYIRNKHQKEITKRQVYFGVEQERLHVLQRLKTTILDVIKLNFVTSFLLICSSLVKVSFVYGVAVKTPLLGLFVSRILLVVYVASNPFVYICSMSDLRGEYKKLIRQFVCRRRKDVCIRVWYITGQG